MRVRYQITLEDFQALQQPFTTKAGGNLGFQAAMVACALMALLGVWSWEHGLGPEVSIFLGGLGIVAAIVSYCLDLRSVARAREKHEGTIAQSYERIHCRQERLLEASETGFTASCNCGSVTRPWSELAVFAENASSFLIRSKSDSQIVPKSAFATESEVTTFRAFFQEKLNKGSLPSARRIQFSCVSRDYWNAYWLHILQGGGWRVLCKAMVPYCCTAYLAWLLWINFAYRVPALGIGGPAGLVAAILIKLSQGRKKRNYKPWTIYFTPEEIYLQDSAGQARSAWSDYVGYLENDSVMLLYHNAKLYRIIPRRALSGPGAEFSNLAKNRLSPFDYRSPSKPVNPLPIAKPARTA
jgi:hypothetical protein